MWRSIGLAVVVGSACLATPGGGQEQPAASSPPPSAADVPIAVPPARGVMVAGAAAAAGNNLLWNGTFEGDSLRPWTVSFESSRNGQAAMTGGELCVTVEKAGRRPGDIVAAPAAAGVQQRASLPGPVAGTRLGGDESAREVEPDRRPLQRAVVGGDIRGRHRQASRRILRSRGGRTQRRARHRAGRRTGAAPRP